MGSQNKELSSSIEREVQSRKGRQSVSFHKKCPVQGCAPSPDEPSVYGTYSVCQRGLLQAELFIMSTYNQPRQITKIISSWDKS